MAFLAPSLADAGFNPLFRLLGDLDGSSNSDLSDQAALVGSSRGRRSLARTFRPKFDLRETEGAYELHGDVAGALRDNITIEFTDPQTLVVRGHVERTQQTSNAVLPITPDETGASTPPSIEPKLHQATVEDEGSTVAEGPGSGLTAPNPPVTKTESENAADSGANVKYWISERAVGDFSRAFSFPGRIDQDGVTASLTNGILSITVPKAKKHETRRITIV